MKPEELKELAAVLTGIADGKPWQFEGRETWLDAREETDPTVTFQLGYKIRLKPWELGRSINGHTLPEGAEWHRQDFTADMLPADPPCRPLMFGEARQVEDEWTYDFKEWKSVREYGPAGGSANGGYCHHRTTRPIPFALTPEQIADGWVLWHGGECPVEPESRPDILFRDGKRHERIVSAKSARWDCPGKPGDIIAYKPDPYGKFRQALADGKVIQGLYQDDSWVNLSSPSFNDPVECYRIKPEPQWVKLGPEDVPPGSVIRLAEPSSRVPWLPVYPMNIGVDIPNNGKWKFLSFDDMLDAWQINRPRHRDADGNPTLWEPCRKEAS